MGFSYSTFALIMFTGLLISTPILLSGIQPAYDETMKSYDRMADEDLDRARTDLALDHASFNFSSGYWELTIQNRGETVIDVNRTSILVDGLLYRDVGIRDRLSLEYYEKLFPGQYGYMILRGDLYQEYPNLELCLEEGREPVVDEVDWIGMLPFVPGNASLAVSVYNNSYYVLGNETHRHRVVMFAENGTEMWDRDISAEFPHPGDPTAIEVHGEEIYICGENGKFVKAFDMNMNLLRPYSTNQFSPLDSCIANGKLYAANPGFGEVEIFDLQTGNHLGQLQQNFNKPICVEANTSGYVYVLDISGQVGEIHIFDNNDNFVGAFTDTFANPTWFAVATECWMTDLLFVLEPGSKGTERVLVYNSTGQNLTMIYIQQVIWPTNPGDYKIVDTRPGRILLFSEVNHWAGDMKALWDLPSSVRPGNNLYIVTENGAKFEIL